MAGTVINLAGLINKEKLQELVEKVWRLAASPMLVLEARGEVLAKAGQLPVECLWGKKVPGIELDSSPAARCTARNCLLSKGQVLVPIRIQGDVTGYVLSCSDNDRARAAQEIAATLVSDSIVSQAYSEFEINSLSTEILERYEEINLLYDLGQTLGVIFDAHTIYETVLKKMTEVIGAQKAWIMILDKEGESLHLTAARGLPQEGMTGATVKVGEGISGKVVKEEKPRLIEEADQLPLDLLPGKDLSEIEPFVSFPMMCVPLEVKGRALGVINMAGKRSQKKFTAGDLKLLSTIASQAAISIYNTQLVEELKESERVKRGMEIAERIQMSLLPKGPPRFGGVDLAGRCVPARNIGGDYYDFFTISEDVLDIVIADVSGHSVGAALVMAATRSVLRAEVLQNNSPSGVLTRASAAMYDDLAAAEMFITMFYVRYDRKTGKLTYANGGHNLPFTYRAADGRCMTIDADGMFLGVLDNLHFDQGRARLGSGDILVLYTDGVTEAKNDAGEQFGEERLYRLVQQNGNMTAQGLLDEVYRQVYQHIRDTAQGDDFTTVIMKVTGKPGEEGPQESGPLQIRGCGQL